MVVSFWPLNTYWCWGSKTKQRRLLPDVSLAAGIRDILNLVFTSKLVLYVVSSGRVSLICVGSFTIIWSAPVQPRYTLTWKQAYLGTLWHLFWKFSISESSLTRFLIWFFTHIFQDIWKLTRRGRRWGLSTRVVADGWMWMIPWYKFLEFILYGVSLWDFRYN